MKPFDREALERSAFHIRSNIVRTIASNGEGHAGGALSAADILAVLYFAVMDYDPEDPVHRDKLLLSGGHQVPGPLWSDGGTGGAGARSY